MISVKYVLVISVLFAYFRISTYCVCWFCLIHLLLLLLLLLLCVCMCVSVCLFVCLPVCLPVFFVYLKVV